MSMKLYYLVGLPLVVAAGILSERHSARKKVRLQRALLREAFGTGASDGTMLKKAEEYWHNDPPAAAENRFLLDDATWADLDMDAVYCLMDHCQSVMGKTALYAALRTLHLDGTADARRKTLRQAADADTVNELQYQLWTLRDALGNDYYDNMVLLCQGQPFATPYRRLIQCMAPLPLVALLGFFVSPQVGLLMLLTALVVNFIGTMVLKTRIPTYHAGRGLGVFVSTAQRMLPALETLDPAEAARLRAILHTLQPFKTPLSLLAQDAVLEQQGFPSPGNLFLLPLLAYLRLERLLVVKRDDIRALTDSLGQIDLACAEASFRQSLPYLCLPEFVPEAGVQTTALYHPLLDAPVPNDASLERTVLITGSNASGKSTFMRTVALNCILAQTFGFCTARRFVMRCGGVASSMNNADSLRGGSSYFVSELTALLRLETLARAGYCMLFIDEIFRGTNTIERVAASAALLGSLHDDTGAMCVTATHDMELTQILASHYQMLHFSEQSAQGHISFDYKLCPGPSRTKNALRLLRDFGFPEAMVSSAETLADDFAQSGRWAQRTVS